MISLYPLQSRLRGSAGLENFHGHLVYLPGLVPDATVIDAGAHRGQFSRLVLGQAPCRILALEPNQDLSPETELTERLTWLRAALGGRSGERNLIVGRNPEASSLLSSAIDPGEVERVSVTPVLSLDDLRARFRLERIDLLKLDIEGAEIEVLLETPAELLRDVGQITVEFHSFVLGEGELARIEAVRRRLSALGFLRLHASAPAPHESDTLFLNRRFLSLPMRTRIHVRLVEPMFSLLRRVLGGVRDRLAKALRSDRAE